MVADYRSTILAWGEAQSDAKKANPIFRRLHKIFKQLREDEIGQAGIAALMDDPDRCVRLMAASHSLGWAPGKAAEVLASLADTPGPYALDAQYTLMAFKAGTLNQDW